MVTGEAAKELKVAIAEYVAADAVILSINACIFMMRFFFEVSNLSLSYVVTCSICWWFGSLIGLEVSMSIFFQEQEFELPPSVLAHLKGQVMNKYGNI